MEITTKQFGKIEFEEDRIIKFDSGLVGFEELKSFLLIKQDDELFFWLNSIDEPEMAFPLFGIRVLDESYPLTDQAEPFGIVTLNSDPAKVTINLKAPVYINQDEKIGEQKILDNEEYFVDYNLFVE
jgi:flagellar assembly factor FliW